MRRRDFRILDRARWALRERPGVDVHGADGPSCCLQSPPSSPTTVALTVRLSPCLPPFLSAADPPALYSRRRERRGAREWFRTEGKGEGVRSFSQSWTCGGRELTIPSHPSLAPRSTQSSPVASLLRLLSSTTPTPTRQSTLSPAPPEISPVCVSRSSRSPVLDSSLSCVPSPSPK